MKKGRFNESVNVEEIKEMPITVGKWKIALSVPDIIQIAMIVISFLSFLGVVCTLGEMKKDREAAYKPTILMNPESYDVSWNSNKEEEWLSSLPNKPYSDYKINEDGSISGTGSIPINIFPENALESFTVVNIGVGAAKNIRFSWDKNNIDNLFNYLSKCDLTRSEFCIYDKSVAFMFEDRVVVTDIDHDIKLMYMLADAEETYVLPLPISYSILIHEIIKTDMLEELPYIILYAEYTDVQGKTINDCFFIKIQRTSYTVDEDDSGFATFQLNPEVLSNKRC